jgi:hypothetical protein
MPYNDKVVCIRRQRTEPLQHQAHLRSSPLSRSGSGGNTEPIQFCSDAQKRGCACGPDGIDGGGKIGRVPTSALDFILPAADTGRARGCGHGSILLAPGGCRNIRRSPHRIDVAVLQAAGLASEQCRRPPIGGGARHVTSCGRVKHPVIAFMAAIRDSVVKETRAPNSG